MNLQALLFVMASTMTTSSTAQYTITSTDTIAATSSVENVGFTRQWTLSATTNADIIDSIGLDLIGRVYVSYMSGLPSGIIGFVNISGDSQAIVDAVTVSNDDTTSDRDNDDANEPNDERGELHVGISSSASSSLDGYLLTEIVLATTGVVTEVASQRSAQVVVEDGVLVTSSTTAELQIDASESTSVFVSAASTDVSVRQLQLDATGTSSIQFLVNSVSVTGEAQLETQGSATVSVLSSSLAAGQLELDAQDTGTICLSAQEVTATTYDGQEASRISMPNAANNYGSTGTFACNEAAVPPREPSMPFSTTATGTTATQGTTTGTVTPGAAAGAATSGTPTGDEASAGSILHYTTLTAASVIGVAMAFL